MCEYCSNPFGSKGTNSDSQHIEFAGFFSTDAINAAVQKALASRKQLGNDTDDDESSNDNESDGT
jgi:hypothetical protein